MSQFSLRDRPLAQGVVSNAIFQTLWNGGSFFLGWISAHYAAIAGVETYLALLVGALVFFLLSGAYYFLFRRPALIGTRSNRTQSEGLSASQAAALHDKQAKEMSWEARYNCKAEQVKGLQKQLTAAEEAAITERNKVKALEERITKYPCPEEWLHKMAEEDAESIAARVVVTEIHCRDKTKDGVLPYYYFTFYIENWSVYPIEIGRNISGKIRFAGHDFKHDPVIFDNQRGLTCRAREGMMFVVEQQLYAEEVKHIADAEEKEDFMFGDLKITIKVTGRSANKVTHGRLHMSYGVSKRRMFGRIGDSLHHYA